MAAGDQFLFDVAQRAVLNGLADPDAIAYRQAVLADCLASPAVVRGLSLSRRLPARNTRRPA